MLLMATALLIASPAQRDPCGITAAQYDAIAEDETLLLRKSGPGLSIDGIAFAAADLEAVEAAYDGDFNEWSLLITFTPSGQTKFREAQGCGVGMQIEISVDGRLVSRPMLHEEIKGNQVKIAGGFDEQSATALVRSIAPPR